MTEQYLRLVYSTTSICRFTEQLKFLIIMKNKTYEKLVFHTSLGRIYDTAQHKTTRQNTRQDKARQDKTRQGKTRQGKTRQGKTRQDDTTTLFQRMFDEVKNTIRCIMSHPTFVEPIVRCISY